MVFPAIPHKSPASDEVLISGNCRCYLVRKTDFAGVIKLRILTWGDFPGLSEWPSIQAWCSNWRRAGGDHLPRAEQSRRWWQRLEWRGHVLGKASSHHKTEDTRNGFSFRASRREQGAVDTLIWGIGPPESWQNKFPLFSGMELVKQFLGHE